MGRRFESCRAHHDLQTPDTPFPTNFPTKRLSSCAVNPLLLWGLLFLHWRENRVGVQEFNRPARGSTGDVGIVGQHPGTHVPHERLNRPERNATLHHVRDELVTEIMESARWGRGEPIRARVRVAGEHGGQLIS